MKVIAISLSSDCIQEPRCSFCYQSKKSIHYDSFQLFMAIHELSRKFPTATLTFEYSGYNLGSLLMDNPSLAPNPVTLTTMPKVITKVLCSAVAKHHVSAIALSYDSQKVSLVEEWVEKAKIIKEAGMKVSCNFLLESTIQVPEGILRTTDQLNLLTLKPTGKVKAPQALEVMIQFCKQFVPVAVDNCLGYQLGYIKRCGAGVDFCHIRPDGKVIDCCFQGDCFLWLRNHARKIAENAFDGLSYNGDLEVRDYLESKKQHFGKKTKRR